MATTNNKILKLKNYFFQKWFYAIIIVLLYIIIQIPSIREGINIIKQVIVQYKNTFIWEQNWEKITIEKKLSTNTFDFAIINSYNHNLWIGAEYMWIKRYYPWYKLQYQVTLNQNINDEVKYYDMLEIKSPNWKIKRIYFDISSFMLETNSFIDAWISSNKTKSNTFELSKIKELY